MDRFEEVQSLVQKLNSAASSYYLSGNSPMTDEEWDREYERLQKLEQETGIVLNNSPTHHVGSLVPAENKRKHIKPMLSLAKINSFEALNKWLKQFPNEDVAAELKYDGISVELIYRMGTLTDAITRGTGTEGNSVYYHVIEMPSVPQRLSKPISIDVRGEVVASRAAFAEYNARTDAPLKNERNATAGILGSTNYDMVSKLGLRFIAYDVGASDTAFDNRNEMLTFYKENGFDVTNYHWPVVGAMSVRDLLDDIAAARDTFDFLIDGVVFKLCDLGACDRLGSTDKHPHWAIAYKFAAEGEWTILRSVEWNVSRSGKLTPVAIFDPVELGGTTIGRATLNNYGFIVGSDIQLNDEIYVTRANDVIPKIIAKNHTDESQPVPEPTVCPICGGELKHDGAYIKCDSPTCKPQIVAALEHFCSRDGMNIRMLGPKIIEQLVEGADIANVYELVTVSRDTLESLGFTSKRCDRLMQEIQLAKARPLGNVLYALGIPGLGKGAAMRLGESFVTLADVSRAGIDGLKPIVGDAAARNTWHYIRENEAARKLRDWLV